LTTWLGVELRLLLFQCGFLLVALLLALRLGRF
jgi:hypothetical protein